MALDEKYHITETIGKGSMGVVSKAIQKSLDRFVAIKLIHPHLSSDPNHVLRIEREAKAVASLGHVNVMDIIDFGKDGDQYYIVAEFIDGPTLTHILSSVGKLPINVALSIAVQILKGLEHAHNRGIVHRDVKPDNIMFTSTGIVKLTDFGIAKAEFMPSVTQEKDQMIGSPGFMSPEQALGQGVDQRSDLFSVGVILYRMLCNVMPFPGKTIADILKKLTEEPHVPIRDIAPEVPGDLERIINKALHKNKSRRFYDATEFSVALEMFAFETGTRIGPREIESFFQTHPILEGEIDTDKVTPSLIKQIRPTTIGLGKTRPTAAILPLTGCFGCQVNLLDLHEHFQQFYKMLDIRFSYLMDIKKIPRVDIGIVEGCVGNSENRDRVRELRDNCDTLVALGTCACFGGVPGLRNLHSINDVEDRAYIQAETNTIFNKVPDSKDIPAMLDRVKPVSEVVKVDFIIPGCPSPHKLILDSMENIISGKAFDVPSHTLCFECGRTRSEMLNAKREFIADDVHPLMELDQIDPDICFLEQGVLCMGISTCAGCGGRCVKNNVPCQGCMGPAPHVRETGAKWINTLGSLLPGGSMRFRHDLVGIGYAYTLPISMIPFRKTQEGPNGNR